jgi:hypothetical protein
MFRIARLLFVTEDGRSVSRSFGRSVTGYSNATPSGSCSAVSYGEDHRRRWIDLGPKGAWNKLLAEYWGVQWTHVTSFRH